jgi:hypothetical protein
MGVDGPLVLSPIPGTPWGLADPVKPSAEEPSSRMLRAPCSLSAICAQERTLQLRLSRSGSIPVGE